MYIIGFMNLNLSVVSSEDRNFHLVDILPYLPIPKDIFKRFRPLIQFAKPNPDTFKVPFQNWLKKYSELNVIIDLYADVIYREGNSPTVQFLLLTGACECITL